MKRIPITPETVTPPAQNIQSKFTPLAYITKVYVDIDAVDVNLRTNLSEKQKLQFLKNGFNYADNRKKSPDQEYDNPWKGKVSFVGQECATYLSRFCRSQMLDIPSAPNYVEAGLELITATKNQAEALLNYFFKHMEQTRNAELFLDYDHGKSFYTKTRFEKGNKQKRGITFLAYVRESKNTTTRKTKQGQDTGRSMNPEWCLRLEIRLGGRDAVRRAGIDDIYTLAKLNSYNVLSLVTHGKIYPTNTTIPKFRLYEIDKDKLTSLKQRNAKVGKIRAIHPNQSIDKLKYFMKNIGIANWKRYIKEISLDGVYKKAGLMIHGKERKNAIRRA